MSGTEETGTEDGERSPSLSSDILENVDNQVKYKMILEGSPNLFPPLSEVCNWQS